MDTPIFTERSEIFRKNQLVINIAVLFFLLLFGGAIYKWVILGIRQPMEVFVYLMFALVLIERSYARYTCEVHPQFMRFKKHGLLGTKTVEVSYQSVGGIYKYKPQLMGIIKFRRSYRFNSALDNRRVWVLAYKVQNKKGKTENCRIYFKANEALFELMAEKMPGLVKIKEEQVLLEMLKD